MAGFFPLQRQIMDHWTYKNIYARSLWMHMLMVARYSKEPHTDSYNGHLVTLNYGEFVFGRDKWARELEIPEQRMKTLLKKFIQENMIELRFSYPKGSVYTILNYSKFNQQSNQQSNQQQTLEPKGFDVYAIQLTNQLTNQQLSSNYPENNKVIREQGLKQLKDLKHSVFEGYTNNPLLIETLESFVEFRKKIKHPMTDHAKKLLLNNLDKLCTSDDEKVEVLNQSILQGWKGIFALKKLSTPIIATNRTSILITEKKHKEVPDLPHGYSS